MDAYFGSMATLLLAGAEGIIKRDSAGSEEDLRVLIAKGGCGPNMAGARAVERVGGLNESESEKRSLCPDFQAAHLSQDLASAKTHQTWEYPSKHGQGIGVLLVPRGAIAIDAFNIGSRTATLRCACPRSMAE
jgi:hypothetical protein